jgi:hypothetical protein
MRSLRLFGSSAAFVALLVSVAPSMAAAQTVVNPYFLFLMDSSGSMGEATTCPAGRTTNTCGAPCTKINDAKCALQRVVAGVGDATFGLGQFSQACKVGCGDTTGSTGMITCDTTAASGVIRAGIADGNQAAITSWVDYVCGTPPTAVTCPTTASTNHREIYSGGNTPLEGVLRRALCYFSGTCGADGTPASPLIGDSTLGCRPVSVILLTDGAETCGGTATLAATALRNTPVGAATKNIKTYVIGFGMASGNAAINGIAAAGGTTTGYYATNEETLSLALSQIIADSALVESCNNLDDNCNVVRDEGLTKYCVNTGFGVAAPNCSDTTVDRPLCTLCAPQVETACDGIDNNCDGRIDEALRNLCGTCGAAPTEVCDGFDNDCDGAIDEAPGTCRPGCTPTTEICDGIDNDCDTAIDEGLSRTCGLAIGVCTAGTQTCAAGAWGACTGRLPTAELCNNLDDNCDGIVDGMTQACGVDTGECIAGVQVCAAGSYGTCLGSVGPALEVCDGLDNDCDGSTDESDPGLGVSCGESTSPCVAGTMQCVAGALVCVGATGPTDEICDGIDNDCDGVIDDGLAVGSACGTDTGECSPGINVCTAGVLTCQGEIGPIPETCNALDDDCNGIVDDLPGVGAVCGTDVGECTAGTMQCAAGVEVCVGSRPPSTEVCDCSDNDCDGTVDEEPATGSLCAAGSACVECGCAGPCVVTEFGNSCPTGTVPFMVGTACWCVPEAGRCVDATCAGQTVEQTGAVVCAPGTDGVPVCVCKGNTCTFPCENVICADGTVCEPDTGLCVPPSCLTFGCDPGQYCDPATLACLADPCATVTCAADEACRNGACEASCGGITCGTDEVCHAGVCATELCASVTCTVAGQVCDPANGLCVEDRCAGVTCPRDTACELSSGNCVGDPCLLVRCPAAQTCVDGECTTEPVVTDAGQDGGPDGGFDGGRDAGPDAGGQHEPLRLLASGGGGCVCTVGAGASESGSAGGLAALVFVLGALAARRRRVAKSTSTKGVAK